MESSPEIFSPESQQLSQVRDESDAHWTNMAQCQFCRQFVNPSPPYFPWFGCVKAYHGCCINCLDANKYFCRECGHHMDFEHLKGLAYCAYHLEIDVPCPYCNVRVLLVDLAPGGAHDVNKCPVGHMQFKPTQPWEDDA